MTPPDAKDSRDFLSPSAEIARLAKEIEVLRKRHFEEKQRLEQRRLLRPELSGRLPGGDGASPRSPRDADGDDLSSLRQQLDEERARSAKLSALLQEKDAELQRAEARASKALQALAELTAELEQCRSASAALPLRLPLAARTGSDGLQVGEQSVTSSRADASMPTSPFSEANMDAADWFALYELAKREIRVKFPKPPSDREPRRVKLEALGAQIERGDPPPLDRFASPCQRIVYKEWKGLSGRLKISKEPPEALHRRYVELCRDILRTAALSRSASRSQSPPSPAVPAPRFTVDMPNVPPGSEGSPRPTGGSGQAARRGTATSIWGLSCAGGTSPRPRASGGRAESVAFEFPLAARKQQRYREAKQKIAAAFGEPRRETDHTLIRLDALQDQIEKGDAPATRPPQSAGAVARRRDEEWLKATKLVRVNDLCPEDLLEMYASLAEELLCKVETPKSQRSSQRSSLRVSFT